MQRKQVCKLSLHNRSLQDLLHEVYLQSAFSHFWLWESSYHQEALCIHSLLCGRRTVHPFYFWAVPFKSLSVASPLTRIFFFFHFLPPPRLTLRIGRRCHWRAQRRRFRRSEANQQFHLSWEKPDDPPQSDNVNSWQLLESWEFKGGEKKLWKGLRQDRPLRVSWTNVVSAACVFDLCWNWDQSDEKKKLM